MSGANEIGFSLCRTPAGELVNGPVATGTPNRVGIPIACPPGAKWEGLHHTHPGGVPRLSGLDLATASQTGAKVMCVEADGDLRCYKFERS